MSEGLASAHRVLQDAIALDEQARSEHKELEQTMSDLASLEGGANAAASGSRARPSPRADTPSAGRGP